MEARQVSFKFAKRRHVVPRKDSINVLGTSVQPKDDTKQQIQWSDYYNQLGALKRKAMHYYVVWEILLPICIFTFLRTFRPGNAYLVYYLTKFKGVNEETVNNVYLSWKVYFYLPMIGVGGYIYSKFGYRSIFPLELFFQAICRVLFIFGQGDTTFIIAYICYGLGVAGEAVFYLYRTALVQDTHKLLVTSISSFILYLTMFLSALFSQLYLGTEADLNNPERIHHLFTISIACIVAAGFFGFWWLPGTDKSLIYGPDYKTATSNHCKVFCETSCCPTCETVCCPTNPRTDDYVEEITVEQLENRIEKMDRGRPCCSSKDDSCVNCFDCMEYCCCESRYVRVANSDTPETLSEDPSIQKARILLHYDDGQDMGLRRSVLSLFLQKDGFFWAILWCALMVSQYSTDGDMLPNWLDADPRSSYNGLAEAIGSLTAGCGALIPPFVDKLIKHLSKTHHSPKTEEFLSRGHIWFASICSIIAAGLNIAQYFYRDIFFLYGIYFFYQLILNMASIIASARLTMV